MRKISITPQMLRAAVKDLQKRQLFVKLKTLKDHIQKNYPVKSEALEWELQEKLKYAVCVGLLAKHGNDQYCIPTLREEANAFKTALSAFWEIYENKNRLRNRRKKANTKRSVSHPQREDVNCSNSDESDSNSDESDFV